jgi:hypothetical protein
MMNKEFRTIALQIGTDITIVRGRWSFIKEKIESILNTQDPTYMNRIHDDGGFTHEAWPCGAAGDPEADDWWDVTGEDDIIIFECKFIGECEGE